MNREAWVVSYGSCAGLPRASSACSAWSTAGVTWGGEFSVSTQARGGTLGPGGHLLCPATSWLS